MDSAKAVTHIGLCAGYGGIELGLQRAIPNLRTVALCEIEAFAVANLVAKMEAGFMDPAPIWPNLKTFHWGAFRDRVDILTGGYPCQPFSAAGQRKGKQDPRHLWPWIADGIRLLRPRICFFENVEGHISLGLSDVIEDLAGMGYRTTWGIFSASEVGAPHQRKRVFILAHSSARGKLARSWSDSVLCGKRGESSGQLPIQQTGGENIHSERHIRHNSDDGGDSSKLALASSFGGASGLSGSLQRHEGQSGESDDCGCEVMVNAGGQGPQGHWGKRGHGEGGSEIQTGGSRCSAWPSRPGEQQHEWEPPRVVADSHGIDRSAQAEGREHDRQAGSTGEAVADTGSISRGTSGRQLQSEQLEEGGRHSETTKSGSGNDHGSAGEELGDTGCERQEERQVEAGGSEQSDEVRDMADTSFIGSDGRSDGSCWRSREPGEAGVDATGSGSEGDGMRQTEPPLGGDFDGTAGGLDYAQLCVSCDNRTDELRLLGNGVVPATAHRAFCTLIKELDDSGNSR